MNIHYFLWYIAFSITKHHRKRSKTHKAEHVINIVRGLLVITQYRQCVALLIYRPPNTDMTRFIEHITQIIKSMKTDKKQCYIMGDFNINLLNYDTHQETRACYVDTMFSNACIPLISRPT